MQDQKRISQTAKGLDMEKRLGISMGDPAGVGPEIILKIMDGYMNDVIIYGSYDVLDHYNKTFEYDYHIHKIRSAKEAIIDKVNIIDQTDLKYTDFQVGKSHLYVERMPIFILKKP